MPSKDLDLYAFANLRKSMKKLHKYVNDRGGYTILGYTQLGESTDVSNKLMRVDSLYPTIHLVYLHPTDLNLPITAEYKKLMFTLTNDYENASMQNLIHQLYLQSELNLKRPQQQLLEY
jgi:hypothetical protein